MKLSERMKHEADTNRIIFADEVLEWSIDAAQLEAWASALVNNCILHGGEIHRLELEVERLRECMGKMLQPLGDVIDINGGTIEYPNSEPVATALYQAYREGRALLEGSE